MAEQKSSGEFLSRALLTYCLCLWVAVIIGFMLANRAIENYLAEDDAGEISVPAPAPKAWVHKADEQQREIDGIDNAGTVSADAPPLVAAPVDTVPASAESNSSSGAPVAAAQEVKPAEAPSAEVPAESAAPAQNDADPACVLLFGAVREDATVDDIKAKLDQAGVKYVITDIPTEGGMVHRITSVPYASPEAARKALDELQENGIEAYVSE